MSGEGTEALEKFKDVESVGWVDLDDDVRSISLSLTVSLGKGSLIHERETIV